ncbi:MAG: PQQ-binding-like beta-propeller repeat protein [Alistipes sp.]|nr:PQQ-binding-like beta-propeller repeat protein [Alistipes sp.]
MKRYGVSASLCGHYHKPQLMNFDSLPGIVGRSLMLPTGDGRNYGYTELVIRGDSIHIAEKVIGKPTEHRHTICQVTDSHINSITPSPATEPLEYSHFDAECIITDNAAIYTAAQRVDNTLYYGNSAGEVKAYSIDSKRFKWIYRFRDPIYSTPIVTEDKVIVATLSQGIVALNRYSGKRLWTNNDGNTFIGNGTLHDGYIYIGARGKMYKINCNTGQTAWCYTFGEAHPQAWPTVTGDKLIFGAWDCNLYCIDCNSGKELWRWSNGSKNRLFSPGNVVARVADDRVMIVAPDRYMTAIDLNSGEQIWRIKERKVRESTGLSSDGKVFYSKTMDGQMIAVDMDANTYTELWCTDAGWGYDHSFCPLIVSDDIIYMSNRRGKVAAVSSSGELLGVGKFANSTANDLRIDSNGNIWASFIEGTIWRLRVVQKQIGQ